MSQENPRKSAPSERTSEPQRVVRHLPPAKNAREWLWRRRYSALRHLVQCLILLAFAGTARWGWTLWGAPLLDGTLSESRLLALLPLSDPFALLERAAAGHWPTLTAALGALIVITFYVLLGSRLFCGWVCPVNLVSEAAAAVRQRLGLSADLIRLDKKLRYIFVLATLLISAATGTAAFELVSPQALLWRDVIFGTGLWALAVALTIFALDVAIAKNGWCSHLCPLGAFWSLISRLNHKPCIRISFNDKTCTHCGDCLRVCPEPQIIKFNELKRSGHIPVGDCLQCGRCIEICPEDSLGWLRKNKTSTFNKNQGD